MSQHATELCLLLVDDIYGELTSQVFRTLMNYGRLPIRDILYRTGFTPRQIKHSLSVLVQQHLALWNTDSASAVTFYEANWASAYTLVRWGKYVRAVEYRFEPFVAALFARILTSGHSRIGDLEDEYRRKRDEKKSGSLANGSILNDEAEDYTSDQPILARLHSSIHVLLKARFLTVVHESNFRSEADNRVEAERVVAKGKSQNVTNLLKGNERSEFDRKVDKVLLDWKQGSKDPLEVIREGNLSSIKRHWEDEPGDDERQSKRRRLTNGAIANGLTKPSNSNDPVDCFKEELVLQANEAKVAVTVRTTRLIKLAEKDIGESTSSVYSIILRKLEDSIDNCEDEASSAEIEDDKCYFSNHKVRTLEIVKDMNNISPLKGTIANVDMMDSKDRIHPRHPRRRQQPKDDESEIKAEESANEDDEALESDGNTSEPEFRDEKQDLVHQHLRLLAERPYSFISHHAVKGNEPESWSVPYSTLSKRIRDAELEHLIQSRYGNHALRIVRILRDKGKLDEKTIGNLGLMNPKSLRSALAAMHAGGHLELQELPRDTSRQPSRTIFLWFFDADRCASKVLEETYKAMARCMQRINVERGSVSGVLEKAARSDVRGKEKELLAKDELKVLDLWHEKEEKLLGEIARLDDLVLTLTDF